MNTEVKILINFWEARNKVLLGKKVFLDVICPIDGVKVTGELVLRNLLDKGTCWRLNIPHGLLPMDVEERLCRADYYYYGEVSRVKKENSDIDKNNEDCDDWTDKDEIEYLSMLNAGN